MLARNFCSEESSWRDMVQEVYSCYSNAEEVENFRNICLHLWKYHKDWRSKSALKKLRKLFNTVRFVTKLKPCESYFTVKGAALILPQSDETAYTRKVTKSHAGDDIQSHLQAMFSVLRPQDTIKVAVKLEGTHTRYLVVVSCIGRQDTEESVILGMDLLEKATVGLILPVWSHMHIQLDGDGGFSIQSDKNTHIFKPVSVQAMWSALQSLNKVVKIAKDRLYIPRGLTHTWVGYYEAKLTSEAVLVSEWNITADIDRSYRSDKSVPLDISAKTVRRTMSTPVNRTISLESSSEEDIYKRIRLELKNVMMTVDLEEVTCLFLRRSIEEKLGMDLKKYKGYIDTEMMEILGQMDSPSKILDHLYLGSEWNASNLEELQQNGVHHILNISREIDNFYPGVLHYMNVREWDVDHSDLMKYWEDTHRYINKARRRGSKALVHCKMGISRSASTVIAYLMKENKWSLQQAFDHTKSKRSIINPNPGFMKQLETYEGILNANWNKVIFNRHAPAKPMSPTEETEEGPEAVQSFTNPEDFLALKMAKSLSDPGEIPFIHVEPDIEIASRSADSTEDSLPDQLSPEAADRSGKKKFKYSKSEGDQVESGDYISASSTESSYTSSDELSSDDEAEDDENDDNKINVDDRESKVFVPINIPDVHTDTVQERKKAVKVEGRRCKSESDKNLLAVDEKFTREGSVSKFKPDGSWIKPASESETENNEKGEGDADTELKDDAEQTDSGGLWMGAKPDSEIKENIENKMDVSTVEDDKSEDVSDQNKIDSTENIETVEQNITDHFVRENIPWEHGKVQKQKKDIEGKYGPAVSKNRDSIEGSEEQQQKISSGNSEEIEKEKPVEQTSQATEDDVESLSVVKSEESSPLTDQSVKIEVDRGSESPKASAEMKRSVYEEEEIDLPEGIVRKTTMEIEERSRSSLDIPGKNLKRSSSLKSTRVTPKAKDRDNERRKTCIALLSPTHPDYTEREQNDLFYLSSNAESTSTESDHDQADAALNKPSNDTEESSQTGSVKVYKFMGEELTVQEGLVRKQTMDIESKSQEPLTKQQMKSDAGFSPQEYCSNLSDTATDSKQISPVADSNLKCGEKSSTDQDKNRKTENYSDISPEKLSKSDVSDVSDKQGVENISQKGKFGPSTMFTPVKKQSRLESRFDSETLELIREIGSALLNSPAKSELEENENEDLKEGESLVSHYVKKIERISGVGKRKPQKEIIIIDKNDSVGDKKSHLGGPSGKTTMTEGPGPSDSENKPVTSKWSPVAKKQSITSQCSKEKEEQTSPQNKSANPKWSPVSRKDSSTSAVEKLSSPDFTTTDKTKNKSATQSEESHIQKTDLTLKLKSVISVETDSDQSKETVKEESEVCSVKKLLGKFEQPEQVSGKVTPVFGSPSILSPSSNTQFFPGAKSDSSNSNFLSSPSASSTHSPGSEFKGQGHLFSRSKSPLLHRQSEPVIHLSEKSMMMFESKLNEMGTSLYDKSPVKEESDTDEFKAEKDQNESKVVRPKSASYGPAAGRRVNLRQCETLPESQTGEQAFTWEGKKVRKLYGKTHPLAKLEGRKYRDSARNSPFYNTM